MSMPIEQPPELGPPVQYPNESSRRVLGDCDVSGGGIGALMVVSAGEQLGATTEWMDSRLAISTFGDKRFILNGYYGSESALGMAINKDKLVTKTVLVQGGVPTPPGRLVESETDAIEFQREFGGPIVLKPRFGNKGKAVTVGLRNSQDIIAAYNRIGSEEDVLAEHDVEGVTEYRCIATDTKCLSVVRRVLPWVEGDGVHTIEDLIRRNNEARSVIPSGRARPTPIDAITRQYLSERGLGLDTVLPLGQKVTVRNVGGLSSGGVAVECSSDVSDGVKRAAVAAVNAVPGLTWAGVDIMMDSNNSPFIIEINSAADFSGADFPMFGTPGNVADELYRIRLGSAMAVPTDRPKVAHQNAEPISVKRISESLGVTGTRFAALLRAHLRSQGWEVEQHSRKIFRVVDGNHRQHWLSNATTEHDLAVTHLALTRHQRVRKLLKVAGIRRTWAYRVRKAEDVKELLKETPRLLILPSGASWAGANAPLVTNVEDLVNVRFSSDRVSLAQALPHAPRYRVFATPHEAITVLGAEPHAEAAASAAAKAVEAVRAIPGLRWVAVDLVVRLPKGKKPVPLVEGMSQNPILREDDMVLAGDFESLVDRILE